MENEDTNPFITKPHESKKRGTELVKQSKSSLKSSHVSFEPDSDEDNFANKREHFQKNKSASSDHRNVVIKVSIMNDDLFSTIKNE